MDQENLKKYKIMENVLNKINQKYISIPENVMKQNRHIMEEVTNNIILKMCNIDPIFSSLYEKKCYAGSVYDNLKISKAEEYDIDVVFKLPFECEIIANDKPGFVQVLTKYDEFVKSSKAEKFRNIKLDILLEENYLSVNKVLQWMQSLFGKTLKVLRPDDKGKQQIVVNCDGNEYPLSISVRNNAPAFTIKLNGTVNEHITIVDIDFVPSFKFNDTYWPQLNYRANPSNIQKTFLIVPKIPKNETNGTYWRLSFQEQERNLLINQKYCRLKPALRLMKKLRDKLQHEQIASYYIKTVFLWETESRSQEFWNQPLSIVFMEALKMYYKMISDGIIPYFWNKDCNLLCDINKTNLDNIKNRLKRVIDDVDKNSQDPFVIAKYLVSKSDLDQLKTEVDFGKKQLNVMNSFQSLITSESRDSGISDDFSSCDKSQEILNSLEQLNTKMNEIYDVVVNIQSVNNLLLKFCENLNTRVQQIENAITKENEEELFLQLE